MPPAPRRFPGDAPPWSRGGGSPRSTATTTTMRASPQVPLSLHDVRDALSFIAGASSTSRCQPNGAAVPNQTPLPLAAVTPDPQAALERERSGSEWDGSSPTSPCHSAPALTLRDLLAFLCDKRSVAAEYSVGLVNNMFATAAQRATLSAADVHRATHSGVYAADWAAIVRLALAARAQREQRQCPTAVLQVGTRAGVIPSPPKSKKLRSDGFPSPPPSPRGTVVRRAEPFRIPSMSPRRPHSRGRSGSRGRGHNSSPPRAAPLASNDTGSEPKRLAAPGGRLLPVVAHPPWSAHAGDRFSDGFDDLLVDSSGRTLTEVNALRGELRRLERARAAPNSHGVIFCDGGASSAVIVDVGHSSAPKFLRSCHVPRGPSNAAIEEVLSSGSGGGLSSSTARGGSSGGRREWRRPLTTREKQRQAHQQQETEDALYQGVLCKLVSYLS